MKSISPPVEFGRIAAVLEDGGYEAWAVGGALRDELAGLQGADWDLATDARPAEVQNLFPQTVPIGIEHGTVGVLGRDGVLIEVTTFRRDVSTDGRHAVVEFAETIQEDLARRDFTINAFAWRPATGELLDPFAGQADLDRQVLRAVGEPEERFSEDYLRVLRGLRFAGKYGLRVDPATEAALRAAVPRLDRLSPERVREELLKSLVTAHPSSILARYGELGVLEVWYPELAGAPGEPGWKIGLQAIDVLRPQRPLLRVARLLATAEWKSEDRAKRAEVLLRRLRFSNADVRRVAFLATEFETLPSPLDSDATLREWLAEVGEAWADLCRLHAADARVAGSKDREEPARRLIFVWRRLHAELLSHHPLRVRDLAIDGADLLELGVPQGPAIGLILDEIHAEVLEEPELNERQILLDLAAELSKLPGLEGAPTVPDAAEAMKDPEESDEGGT